MSILLRVANQSDIDNVILLWNELQVYLNEVITDLNPINIPKDLSIRRNHYFNAFASDKSKVFVMENNNELVGFMELCINEKDFDFGIDRYGYIAYFYVKPGYRDVNCIAKLYCLGEEWVKSKGVRYICSDVDGENNISYKLQKRFWGFKPYKIRLAKEII